MTEAATDSCSSGTLITDEWFSYDKDGRPTIQWESTPHSGTYYEAIASYTGPALTAVQLANPSLYTMTYGLEGEGRWNTLTDTTASQNIVTKTTFNPSGQPLNIQLTGTTPDQDIYTYDPNTGNMKTFEFEVGDTPANLTGTLGWNTNGPLGQLALADGFNAEGTGTCYSNSSGSLGSGYDDLERLIEFDCGSGNWGQEFSYDQYDNLSKSVISGRTGTTWNPGYSATTNHCDSPCTYDSNGDVTGDGNDVYGWNAFSKVAWTATSGTPTCGTSGKCATYDAFGRMVEASVNSTWHEYWYTQAGKMVMAGTTLSYGRWPTSSGIVETVGTTNFDYLHADWLGNSRIVSNIGSNSVVADQAYTPYGEIYNIFGANNTEYQVFTATIADLAGSTTTPTMWDTPNRELSYTGRWLSPDPAGLGSFDPGNSQNWNLYAYVLNNPLSNIDPLGLDCVRLNDDGSVAAVNADGVDNCYGDNGYYVDGTILGGINGVTSSADGDYLQYWLQGNDEYQASCIADDCSSNTGGVVGQPGTMLQYLTTTVPIYVPNDVPLSPSAQRYVTAIAKGAPTLCGGGAFGYYGKGVTALGAKSFTGVIVEADSQSGMSGGVLNEAGAGGVGVGSIVSVNGSSGLVYTELVEIPFFGSIGIVGFPTGAGVYVEGEVVNREVGGGAYANIVPNAGCKGK
jgi:hypothetical protein